MSLKYLFKETKGFTFLGIFIAFLIPCACIAFAIPIGDFAGNILGTPTYTNWPDMFALYFKRPMLLLFLIPGVLFISAAKALCTSNTMYHFKIGKFKMTNVFTALNNYFIPSILDILFNIAIYLATFILFLVLAYMWNKLFSLSTYLVFAILTAIILIGIMVYITSAFVLFLPHLSNVGILGHNGILDAYYLTKHKMKNLIFIGLFNALVITITAIVLYYLPTYHYVKAIINAVILDFALTLSFAFQFVAYYDINNMTREDINSYKGVR